MTASGKFASVIEVNLHPVKQLVLLFPAVAMSFAWQPAAWARQTPSTTRTQYEIELDVDVQQARMSGRASVRFFNTTKKSIGRLVFVLYPDIARPSEEEPLIAIEQVRSISNRLDFKVEEARLEVELEEPLDAGQSVEVQIDYRAAAPRIDDSQTTLTAHLTDQVAVALGHTRRVRPGSSSFYAAGQSLILVRPYPVLAYFDNGEWILPPSSSPSDPLFTQVADYSVSIWTNEPMQILATGMDDAPLREGSRYLTRVRAHRVRDFGAVLFSSSRRTRTLQGSVPIEVVCETDGDGCGKLESISTQAAKLFTGLYGDCPFEALKILAVPMPQGENSVAFSGMVLISTAYARHVRLPADQAIFMSAAELSPLIESTLEASLVSSLATQWWGLGVAFNPSRNLYFAEALRSYAVSQYFDSRGEWPAYDKQLRTSYRVFRTFGGADRPSNRSARQYANDFELSAIAAVKGGLFFKSLEEKIGKEQLSDVLRKISAEARDHAITPRQVFEAISSADGNKDRVWRMQSHWLEQRHGDDDVERPEFVISISRGAAKPDGGSGNVFARLGRFFFTQMTRVGKSASKPF